jgi:hypothetical protein
MEANMNWNLVIDLIKQPRMMWAALAIAALIAITLIVLAGMGQELNLTLGDLVSLVWRAKP